MADIHRAIGMGSGQMLDKLLPEDRDKDADADVRIAHTTLYATYRVDRPGNPRGCETWEDAGSWWHSGSIRRSCVNAR
jgi:hypothetical protein